MTGLGRALARVCEVHALVQRPGTYVVCSLGERGAAAAYALARGEYQRAILDGRAYLSGADLRGKARRYGGHYARSMER